MLKSLPSIRKIFKVLKGIFKRERILTFKSIIFQEYHLFSLYLQFLMPFSCSYTCEMMIHMAGRDREEMKRRSHEKWVINSDIKKLPSDSWPIACCCKRKICRESLSFGVLLKLGFKRVQMP